MEKNGGPPHVIALPMLLEQVLLNLLLNANDAIQSRHRVAEVSEGKIAIGLERRDHHGDEQWDRNSSRRSSADIRSDFHDQAGERRNWPWSINQLRHHQRFGRCNPGKLKSQRGVLYDRIAVG